MRAGKNVEHAIESFIFASRWIQAPLYAGLVVAGVVYAYKFLVELLHLVMEAKTLSEEMVMLTVITLVDITMVANLLIMVIIGGYATFVSHLNLDHHEDKPDWLKEVDAGTLKVKLAGSLAGVSGIHLLKSFIDIQHRKYEEVTFQIIIHAVFLVSTLMLAWAEKVLHSKHKAADGHHHDAH